MKSDFVPVVSDDSSKKCDVLSCVSEIMKNLDLNLLKREKELDEQFIKECFENYVFESEHIGLKESWDSLKKIDDLYLRISFKEAFMKVIFDVDEQVADEFGIG